MKLKNYLYEVEKRAKKVIKNKSLGVESEEFKKEKIDIDATLNILEKDCSYYIELLRKNNIHPFHRGTSNRGKKVNEILYLKQVRKDRKPLGMSEESAEKINEFLDKHNHCRRDKSVMATSNPRHVLQYFGNPDYIFPMGNFHYTWCKSRDINFAADKYDLSLERLKGNTISYFNEKDEEIMNEFFVTDKGIKEAYHEEFEIWFQADSYYLMSSLSGAAEILLNKLGIKK